MTETPTTPIPPHRDPWAASSPVTSDAGAGQWPPTPAPSDPAESPRRRRPTATLAATAVLAALLGGGAGALTATYADDDQPARSTSAQVQDASQPRAALPPAEAGSTTAVAEQVLPSVVSISVATRTGGGSGSGIVLDEDGNILTNNHVVEAAAQGGRLTVSFQDGTSASAELVGADPGADIAVIRVEDGPDLVPVEIGSSEDLRVGDPVVAVGSPLGLSGTVTEGIVSAKDRPVGTGGTDGGEGAVLNAIQTDTAINPGNSGGALVDMSGRLVGVNSAIATLGGGQGGQSGSIGLGFAIPVDQAVRIADELIEDGVSTRALLGAQVGDAQGEGGVGAGAQLGPISSGSGAEEAGLRQGDVVTRLDDQILADGEALVAAVRSAVPGSTVPLTYVRDGETQTVDVTLGSVESS